jgi:hypothetical protein
MDPAAAYTVRLSPLLAIKMERLKAQTHLSGTAVLRLLIHRAEDIHVQFEDKKEVLGKQGTGEQVGD